MIIVRYEGPSGAPGMPEMLDPTSRITTLCRERRITVALMTDARFSGGSVGLVIGHVGPEAALGGPIALVQDGDEIIADLNKNELNCTALSDPAVFKQRKAAWDRVVAAKRRHSPELRRCRHAPAAPCTAHGGSGDARRRPASESRGVGARAARGQALGLYAEEQAPAGSARKRSDCGWGGSPQSRYCSVISAPRRLLSAMNAPMNSCRPVLKISSMRLFSSRVRIWRAWRCAGPWRP